MIKQKLQNKIHHKLSPAFYIVVAAVFVASAMLGGVQVYADSFDQQIKALQQQNAQNNAAVAQLSQQATSYQDAINRAQSQITILQNAIVANQAKQADLEKQIKAAEEELAKQKRVLGENIRQMYLDGQISTLEMLASSKDLSEFVDKQQYRSSVQDKIKTTMDKITELRHQLTAQKQEVEGLIASQKDQQNQMAQVQAQQAQLLAMNQAQQADYNQKTKDNQAKIDRLVSEQIAANNIGRNGALVAGASSYPFANAGFSMSAAAGCVDNDGPDPWGYCTRQCVSYAAWAVLHSGRRPPMYYGNARDWVWHALREGVPVYSFSNPAGYDNVRSGGPQPGDVAISVAGTWGHAMYVESVNGNQVWVSQYNAGLQGEFSHQWRDASNYYFLRFQ